MLLTGYFNVPNLFSQPLKIDEAVPLCYRYYHMVSDHYSPTKYWDKQSNDNANSFHYYHGGANQLWMVTPTFPGSNEVMFINADGGKILDRSIVSDPNNLFCYSGKHHGGGNQLFKLEEEWRTYSSFYQMYIIYYSVNCADVYKVIDRSLSTSNLYCRTPNDGNNQMFTFFPASPIPNSGDLTVFNLAEGIDLPPQPISIDDPGTSETIKHNYTLVGETIVPFAYVEENNKPWSWQALNTPYYRLRRYQYYKLVDKKSLDYGINYEISSTYTVGLTSTIRNLIKSTFGVEQTYSGEIAVPLLDNLLSAKFGANLQHNWGIETSTETSATALEQKQDIVKFSKTIDDALRVFVYRLVDEYKLYRIADDIPVVEWEITTDKNQLFLSWPHSKITMDSKLKSNYSVTNTFIQSESENLIPYMTANNYPLGVASASSSYSSSYYPWKALDYETAGWTLWISTPTGTFTGQWLSYEFDEPVTIMAYNILPQTGNSINRAPKNWKLQAWNGSYWQTLDSRSNYTISSWLEDDSRKFTVQYPKKFQRFRLYVEQVNGSDVVSIRNFKIFGINSSSSKKSSINNYDVHIPVYAEFEKANFDIYPNPNSGSFKIIFSGMGKIQESNLQDSLKNYQKLKAGIAVDQDNELKNLQIEIFDLRGKMVYSELTHEDAIEINLENLNKGIYIVKAMVNNRDIITKKILIE